MKFAKILLSFTLGAGVGAFVMSKILKNAMEAELEEIREFYKAKMKNADKEVEKLVNEFNQHEEDMKKDFGIVERKVNEEENDNGEVKQGKIDYSKFQKPNLEELARKYSAGMNEHPEDDEPDAPYLITAEQFVEDRLHYDKVTFTYYLDDSVLANEEEELISDADYYVGDILDMVEEAGTVYVRNSKINMDMEILVIEQSYSEDILGVEEE